MGLVHHDLCFGCGSANLFGLQIELDSREDGVGGRFFVKQDHQGPPGVAHPGVVAAALEEAMSLAVGLEEADVHVVRVEIDQLEPAPVGTFVQLSAHAERRDDGEFAAVASAQSPEGATTYARVRASYASDPPR